MQHDQPLEQVIQQIQVMPRERCVAALLAFEGLPLDFDAAFLATHSVDWLRHTLLAAVLTTRNRSPGKREMTDCLVR
ncbi:MAG: hypothetical protein WD079_04405 [Phycisphaeraceae bacterium]